MNKVKYLNLVLKKLDETAIDLAEGYALQHKDLETFLLENVDDTMPSPKLAPIAVIIKELARAKILGLTITKDQVEGYKETIDKITLAKDEFEHIMPLEERMQKFEKFKHYGDNVLIKTAQFRLEAMALVQRWKREGGDFEEFIKEHTPCKCGECNPHDKVGKILSGVVGDMMRVILKGNKSTDEEVDRWMKGISEAFNIMDIEELTHNLTLN